MTDPDRPKGDFDKSLRHAISLHPRPFRVNSSSTSLHHHDSHGSHHGSHHASHHTSPHRQPIPTEGIPADSPRARADARGLELNDLVLTKTANHAKSTAYEVTGEDARDPVARNTWGPPSPPPSPGFEEQNELEGQRTSRYNLANDPYRLSSGIKTASEIATIKANTIKRRSSDGEHDRTLGCIPMPNLFNVGKDKLVARRVQHFYEDQNENIERLLKPVDDHRQEARDLHGDNQLKYKIAVQGSFIANVVLAGLQVYGAASSGSLSLFTTMADALFDPLSNVMLILSNRAVNRVDPRKYPSGKARIETAGNIVFCFLMTSVSLIIIVQSIQELVKGSEDATKGFHLPSIIAVAVAFCTKLALFIYCYALRNIYSQIRILWEDHRNDLLINGFGLLTSVGGSKLRWWIDPAGAIALSCLIIFLWLRTAYSEFQLLIGVSAETQMLQHITYIAMTHSPDNIRAIDTVRAYHSGPRLIVEVDIVMDPDASLRYTHDVAEELQTKLESLPNVERAYVHVDFETDHRPEHFLKKEL